MLVKDKPMLILQYTDFKAKLNWNAGFALADPLGVFFKNGKYFFVMRNCLILDYPAFNLINLPVSMSDKIFNFNDFDISDNVFSTQALYGQACFIKITRYNFKVCLVCFYYRGFTFPYLLR
jgi:hypothetical protein